MAFSWKIPSDDIQWGEAAHADEIAEAPTRRRRGRRCEMAAGPSPRAGPRRIVGGRGAGGRWLFRSWLFAGGGSQFAAGYRLFSGICMLNAACCMLNAECCWLVSQLLTPVSWHLEFQTHTPAIFFSFGRSNNPSFVKFELGFPCLTIKTSSLWRPKKSRVRPSVRLVSSNTKPFDENTKDGLQYLCSTEHRLYFLATHAVVVVSRLRCHTRG